MFSGSEITVASPDDGDGDGDDGNVNLNRDYPGPKYPEVQYIAACETPDKFNIQT